jgi:hypothetical protein
VDRKGRGRIMAAPWPAIFEEAERAKIVKLYCEHGLSVSDLGVRLRCGRKRIARVLAEAGVRDSRPRHYQEAP